MHQFSPAGWEGPLHWLPKQSWRRQVTIRHAHFSVKTGDSMAWSLLHWIKCWDCWHRSCLVQVIPKRPITNRVFSNWPFRSRCWLAHLKRFFLITHQLPRYGNGVALLTLRGNLGHFRVICVVRDHQATSAWPFSSIIPLRKRLMLDRLSLCGKKDGEGIDL